MLRIGRMLIYMIGFVMAGTSLVSCTQGKVSYPKTVPEKGESGTRYVQQESTLSENNHFSYEVKDNFIVLKKYTGNEKNINIPETIDDMEVRGIEARCFENTTNENAVNCVRIPPSVSNINTMAFYNSKFLDTIVCDDNMNYLSENGILYTSDMISLIAYPENKSDTEYMMPNSVTKIYNNAFSFCKNLKKIQLSENLEIIPDYAFAYNSDIESIIAYGNITHIGFASFCRCENLKEIYLSDTVEDINEKAILFCDNLESITVNSNNPTLKDYAESIGIDYTSDTAK